MPRMDSVWCLLAVLLTLANAQRYKEPVPFSSKLIGRRFFKFDNCNRSNGIEIVKIFKRTFVYSPFFVTRFNLGECEERYVYHIRRDGKDPFIVYFPPLKHPKGFGVNLKVLERFCEKRQGKMKKKYFPVGRTRKMFEQAVKTIVKASLIIRDFGCVKSENPLEGFVEEERSFKNVDLDGIVTYLLSVGYQYKFCAETNE